MLKRILCLLLAVMMIVLASAVTADEASLYDKNTAYILNPPVLPDEPKTKHEFINVLMVGVDYGILTSGQGKDDIKNCHTDSVIMIAIDLTANKVNLISIPRDTLTYVPGVYGIYKLNAAINCAPNFSAGIDSVQNTVAWILGGIRPDHYLVITPHLVEEIGDRIGGMDIDVEMSYLGHSGRTYTKGFQHLDGVGIMDYARARRNATKNNNDYGRTIRQRVVLNTLYQKIMNDADLVFDILDVIVENYNKNIFSDLSEEDIRDMLSLTDQVVSGNISDYVLDGDLGMAMKYFNSSFIDQKKRQEVIREVYGIDIPKQHLNSRGYYNYLFKYAFSGVKVVRISNKVIDWAQKAGFSGDTLNKAVEERQKLINALSAVDDKLERNATLKVEKHTNGLKQAVANLKKACGYPEKITWGIVETDKWYMDPDINQYNNIDWN